MMKKETIRISEIFGPTIQGEGALIGQPTIFVRTGGCDYRCSWCDTAHAVDKEHRKDWTPMTAETVFKEIQKLSGNTPMMISLSGGNPAIQPLKSLIDLGHKNRYKFALETQGSIAQEWFFDLNYITFSPKPPSSGMEIDYEALDTCVEAASYRPEIAFKFVIKDEEDYCFARNIAKKYSRYPIYLQPCNLTPPTADDDTVPVDLDGIMERMDWLISRVAQDKWYDAHILPQLHVLLWGNKRGV